ncbi:MAG: hypothetical protein ACREH6_05115 [Geminicoccaceae bacterium]
MSARAGISSWPQGVALLVALAGLILCALGALTDVAAFFRSYVVALMAFWQLPLGCLALLIASHLAGGRWSLVIGDALEAGARTLPLMAILFVPVLFNLDAIYPWARPDYLAEHETVARKAAYLAPGFFTLRSLVYLAVWLGLCFALTEASRPFAVRPRRRAIAAIGAILYAASATLASFDWLMSLDPRYGSTIFGMLAMSGQAVGAFSLAVLVTLHVSEQDRRLVHLREERLVGLGSLLLGLVLLWVYFAFIQLLIGWSGNLPPDAAWYLARIAGPWRLVVWLLVVGHFALPVAILLSSRARRSWRVVMTLAGLVLVMRILDVLWLAVPAFEDAPPVWLVAGALAAIGGLWLCAFLWLIADRVSWVAGVMREASHG